MTPAILVVDDDADCRESLQLVLEDAGYAVVVAADGCEALQALETGPRPAAILLDLMMPVMDGRECLAEIKRRPAVAAIPVIIVSAWGKQAQGVDAAQGFLDKPVGLVPLLELIEHHVARGGGSETGARGEGA
jgi:CheY-like chemotaxis protein